MGFNEAQAQAMAVQEEENNDIDEEDEPTAKTRNDGEVINISSPMGNFDFQVRKRKIKKTVQYVDINGNPKQAEITEEEI